MKLVLGIKISRRVGTEGAPALGRRGQPVLGELVCLLLCVKHHLLISPQLNVGIEKWALWRELLCLLLCVEHHLLISPLSKMSVGIEKWAGWRDLTLLLLDGKHGIGMMAVLWRRIPGWHRRRIIRRRQALARNRGVGCARI